MTFSRTLKYSASSSRNGLHQFLLSSYREFLDLFSDAAFKDLFDGDYLFRGQENALWRLEPSLTRSLRSVNSERHNELRIKHLRNFCMQLRGYPNLVQPEHLRRTLENIERKHMGHINSTAGQRVVHDTMVQDEVDLWSIGQHRGLATPLLDWSRSPLDALFFAFDFSKSPPPTYCALFAFNMKLATERSKIIRDQGRTNVIDFVEPIGGERSRILAQNGLFSLCTSSLPIEHWVTSNFSSEDHADKPVLIKFVIPTEEAEKCQWELGVYGATALKLFPDLEGVCKSCNSRFENQKGEVK